MVIYEFMKQNELEQVLSYIFWVVDIVIFAQVYVNIS